MTTKHEILIIGGGSAGITVAARLLRKGHRNVAIIEPATRTTTNRCGHSSAVDRRGLTRRPAASAR